MNIVEKTLFKHRNKKSDRNSVKVYKQKIRENRDVNSYNIQIKRKKTIREKKTKQRYINKKNHNLKKV